MLELDRGARLGQRRPLGSACPADEQRKRCAARRTGAVQRRPRAARRSVLAAARVKCFDGRGSSEGGASTMEQHVRPGALFTTADGAWSVVPDDGRLALANGGFLLHIPVEGPLRWVRDTDELS